MRGTCDWCKRSTDQIQSGARKTALCPTCCPDVDASRIPEEAPPQWHFMNETEREDWLDGLTVDEIRERHDWGLRRD